jgi:protein ImuB
VAEQLADLPIRILPAGSSILELLDALGVRTLGQFAALKADAIADRFGVQGRALHQLAKGDDVRVLQPRVPSETVSSKLQFPEPIGSEIALQRALSMLAGQAVHHPLCASYAPRIVRVVATLATGGSWQSRRALRIPSIDPLRIALTAQAKLDEIPAPVEELMLELMSFELRSGVQETLQVDPGRGDVNVGAQVATRRVQEAVGEEALLQVLELEPWSRMSERHAVLVPIDVGEAS